MASSEVICSLPTSGIYAITILLPKEERLNVGSLGSTLFAPGFYVYVGSARPNLRQRVARHLASEKRLRWHVDYLTRDPNHFIVEVVAWRSGSECDKAALLKKSSDGWVGGFGASDCLCGSHLIYYSDAEKRMRAVRSTLPDILRSLGRRA